MQARKAINEKLDPHFDEKFENVRPVIEQYEKEGKLDNMAERAAENNKKFTEKRKQREQEEEPQIAEVISTILHESTTDSTEAPVGHWREDGSWSDEAKKPRGILFGPHKSKEEIEAMYKNLPKQKREILFETNLDTPEKRAQNRINVMKRADALESDRQKKRSVAQKLAAWWKGLDDKNKLN